MPELPEVEIVRRRLATCLPGLSIVGVEIGDAASTSSSTSATLWP
jgi:formamidopyrimidine-DNA glycosylase